MCMYILVLKYCTSIVLQLLVVLVGAAKLPSTINTITTMLLATVYDFCTCCCCCCSDNGCCCCFC